MQPRQNGKNKLIVLFSTIQSFFNNLLSDKVLFGVSVLLGFFGSLTVYLTFLQRHYFSYTYLLLALIIWILLSITDAWLIKKIFERRASQLSPKEKITSILFSTLFSVVILLNIQIHPLYYLLSDKTVDITIPNFESTSADNKIALLWMKTGQGFIHYSNMSIEGNWIRENNQIKLKTDSNIQIHWSGKVGSFIEIAFGQTNFDQSVIITFDGVSKTIKLDDPKAPIIKIRLANEIALINYLPYIISFIFAVSFYILIILFSISEINHFHDENKTNQRTGWLLYAFPMIAT